MTLPKFRDLRLRFRVVFLACFIGLPLIAILVIVTITGIQANKVITTQTGESVRALAISNAQRLNGELLEKINLLQTLSRDYPSYAPTITARESQTARLSRQGLRDFLGQQDTDWKNGASPALKANVYNNAATDRLNSFGRKFAGFTQIMLLDRDGGLLAASGADPKAFVFAEEGWWQRVAAQNNDVQIEAPRVDQASKQAFVELIIPVVSNVGQTRAYLYAVYRLDDLRLLAGPNAAGAGSALTLVDQNGLVVVDTGNTKLEGQAMQAEVAGTIKTAKTAGWYTGRSQQQQVIYSFSPIGSFENLRVEPVPWTLVVSKNRDEALSHLYSLLTLLVLVGAILVVIVVLAGLKLASVFTHPIKNLTQTANALLRGDFSVRAPIGGFYEFNILAQTFNSMTSNLVHTQAELTASIGSLPFGFAIIDDRNRIVFSNALLSKLLGHAIPADPDQTPAILERINQEFAHTVGISQLVKEAQTRQHTIEKNIEYGPRFFRLFFAPVIVSGGQVAGTIMIMEDTTEQMALIRSRDEFFSIASHELRTPLTAVRGNSDMILRYYKEQVKDPGLHQMVTDIHDASIRLIAIVSDFLDTSRLELGQIALSPRSFDIAKLIQDTIREYDVTGSRRKLALTITPPALSLPPVYADYDRTRQILVNLLGNAIKYTKKGGVAFTVALDNNMLEVTVTDTGDGIAMESQHLLFHKFQQAAGNILTRDSTRSTGLGLYISKLLCEGMGGKIRLVRSVVGEGSSFAFSLPIATPRLIKRAQGTETTKS